MKQGFLTLTIFIFSGFPLFGESIAGFDVCKLKHERIDLTQYFKFARTQNHISAAKAKGLAFQPLNRNSFKATDDVFWLRLNVLNSSNEPVDWIFDFKYPVFDSIQIYQIHASSVKLIAEGGDLKPQLDWPVQNRYFLTELITEPEESQNYLIRLETRSAMIIEAGASNSQVLIQSLNTEQLFYGIYFGFLILISVYNIFLFVSVRELTYLLYSACVISFGFLQSGLLGLNFQYFWPGNTWWANQSIPLNMFLTLILVLFFTRSYLETKKQQSKIDFAILTLTAFSIPGMILSLTLNYTYSLYGALCLILISIIVMLIAGIRSLINGFRPAYFYVISWSFFLAGVLIYILKTLSVLPSNHFTSSAMFIGSAIEVTLLSLGLVDRINLLNKKIKIKDSEAMLAKKDANLSEKRFRYFIDHSRDLMFALDENYNILSVNDEMSKALRFKKEELQTMNFIELVYADKDDRFPGLMVLEKLEQIEEGNLSNFQLELRHRNLPEPRDYSISFIKTRLDDKTVEILGRGEPLVEDRLVEFLEKERSTYKISNYLRNAELIAQRLTKDLKIYLESEEIIAVRTCLREMIINAIEHGNLEVDFKTKTEKMQEGQYLQFLEERRKLKQFSSRKVTVDYKIDANMIACRITDEGPGFDYRKRNSIKDESMKVLEHGRGILMTEAVFDRVQYTGKGNSVILIKNFV